MGGEALMAGKQIASTKAMAAVADEGLLLGVCDLLDGRLWTELGRTGERYPEG